jgi:exosortase/archaeosortase family protein
MEAAAPRAPLPIARGWFSALAGVALLQAVLAYRAGEGVADDYWLTVVIAWSAALYLASRARHPPASRAEPIWKAVGGLLTAAALIALAATPRYTAVDRILPCAAGAGLGLAAFGPAFLPMYRVELAVLALPLINPIPMPLRDHFAPRVIHTTAWCAYALHRIVGNPLVLDNNELRAPEGTLEVLEGCCGVVAISRLAVLAGLVAALFPSTLRQRVGLFVVAACTGYAMAVVHIAVMTWTVMRRDDAAFEFWHQGPGASVLAVCATAVAGLFWWWMLRQRPKGELHEPR